MSLTEAEELNYKCVIDNDISLLEEIEIQSDELCRYAIEKDYTSLQYIREQTDYLCKYALRLNIRALQYIRNQTTDICKYAINRNIRALIYIRDQTEELCKYGIDKQIRSLEFVKVQTEALCIYALDLDYNTAIEYINNFSERVCRHMISKSPMLLEYIPDERQTEDICISAVMKDPISLIFVCNKTNTICKIAVEQDYSMLKHIDQNDKTNKEFIYGLCVEAILQHPCAIRFIRNQTSELCELAIECSNDGVIMDYITNPSIEICRKTIDKYGVSVLEFIRRPHIEIYKYAMHVNLEQTLTYVRWTDKEELINIVKTHLDINNDKNIDFKKTFNKEKYEFECPIYREDTKTSGYIIKEHKSYDGSSCCPKNVICEEVFIETQKNNICYICRNKLSVTNYIYVSNL